MAEVMHCRRERGEGEEEEEEEKIDDDDGDDDDDDDEYNAFQTVRMPLCLFSVNRVLSWIL
jgi:hypothetical protein